MTARKTLPIGIIVMILMMALAALGVGYAWWTEQLTATGTIQTGSIDVQIEGLASAEQDPLNVTECSPKISSDGKAMTVTVENAYPGYVCTLNFALINHGSVPAKVSGVTLPASEPAFDLTTDGVLQTGAELAPSIAMPGRIRVSILSGASQRANYTFNIGITIVQGNAR